jgi:hypothetical protein
LHPVCVNESPVSRNRRYILQFWRRRLWTRIKCTHQRGASWTRIHRVGPGLCAGPARVMAGIRTRRGTRRTPREPWPGRWMSPGVSHGRVITPAGLDSRADVHLAPTLPCSTVQKLGVRRPAHHSLPWDVQGMPPERPHHRSSRRREGEARPVTPDLRKHSGGPVPHPRPAPDSRRAHFKRAARTGSSESAGPLT